MAGEAPAVRLVPDDPDELGAFVQYNPDASEPTELVPSAAAGNAGSAIPATAALIEGAGVDDRPRAPAARYTGGSILTDEAFEHQPTIPPAMEAKRAFQTLNEPPVRELAEVPPKTAGSVMQIRRPQERGTGGRPAGRGASERSSAKSGDSGSDDGSSDGEGSPGSSPFGRFSRALARYPAFYRCLIDAHGCEESAGAWRLLRLECEDRADRYTYAPLDPEPRKRQTPARGTAQRTSTGANDVELHRNDPLKQIAASVYLLVLAGVEVSSSGRCRCPMPDHEDLRPSCKVYDTILWHCFGCNEGGDIIKLAEAIYGIPARGPDYWRLRDRIVESFLWVPIGREGVER